LGGVAFEGALLLGGRCFGGVFGECRENGGERGKKTHRNISMFCIFGLSLGYRQSTRRRGLMSGLRPIELRSIRGLIALFLE